jgi:[ribosomal protein S18]-alanine N-acetyltransferase
MAAEAAGLWRVRLASFSELPEIVAAMARWPGAPHWTADAWSKFLVELEGVSAAALLLHDGAGRLSGCAAGTVLEDTAELENLVIAPEHRHRGMGGQLLQAWLEWAAGRGAGHALLEVRASNLAALALYRRWGFKEQGRRRGYYTQPTEDAVLMRLSLRAPASPGTQP